MKQGRRWGSLARLAAISLLAIAVHATASARAQSALPPVVAQALAAAGIPQRSVAVLVEPLRGEPLIAVNADRPMSPASTMKLLTTYAGLELLGPAFTWKTDVYRDGPLSGDVLEGDLILRGGGDPKLTLENFWLLLRGLRERGLRAIRGRLVLDRSYFAPLAQDPGEFDGEPLRPYNVIPDALLVNFKSVRFIFVPDPLGRSVRVLVEPHPEQLVIGRLPELAPGPCDDWHRALRAQFLSRPGFAFAGFHGVYPAECGEKDWNVALLDHGDYDYGVFRELWQELGGTIAGGWRDGTLPRGAERLLEWRSPPLAEVVRDINKFSNNVMARQLFLTLSAQDGGPGSAERSAARIRAWLAAKGLALPSLVLENGAGLSRLERISAEDMGKLLIAAWRSPVMPEFVASLPLAALDGTLERRMQGEPLAGHAHLKTGSLTGVRAIAGYVQTASSERYAVVFFINHPRAAEGEPAELALLRWVYDRPPSAAGAQD